MRCAECPSEVVQRYVLDLHEQRDRCSVAGRKGNNQGVDGVSWVSTDPLNNINLDLGKKPRTPGQQPVPVICVEHPLPWANKWWRERQRAGCQ